MSCFIQNTFLFYKIKLNLQKVFYSVIHGFCLHGLEKNVQCTNNIFFFRHLIVLLIPFTLKFKWQQLANHSFYNTF